MMPHSGFVNNYGKHPMAVHTPTQKVTSDDRPYYLYHEKSTLSQQKADPLTKISVKSTLRLLLEYMKAIRKIGCNDATLSNDIFAKVIQTLLVYGISTEKISVCSTDDNSLLVRGKAGNKGFYFETYFDTEEYEDGYEIIANVYQNKHNVASIAGNLDFVFQKLDQKLGTRLVA